MKLSIKNLGPLKKGGTIDLDKRFYVFVGKNNSGKTYVANVLGRLFDFDKRKKGIEKVNLKIQFINDNQGFILDEGDFESYIEISISDWITNQLWTIFNTNKENFENTNLKISGLYRTFLKKKLEIEYYWNFSTKGNTDEIIPTKGIRFNIRKEANSDKFVINRLDIPIDDRYKLARDSQADFIETSTIIFLDEADMYDYLGRKLVTSITGLMFPTLPTFTKSPNPMLLPAHRAFFTSFWKYILRVQKDLLDEAYEARLEGKENIDYLLKTPYTDSTNDLIKAIEYLDRDQQEINSYKDLILELEELIGGSIVLEKGKEGGIGRMEMKYKINETGKNLDMYLASSSVNQVTTLYLYLKYWAWESDNFLIVDEPEENLHPENQIKLLNILAKFADRNNNKVLITTHSTMMTEAVNNYVRMAYLKDKNVDTTEITESSGLHELEELGQDDFGVYYFGEGKIQEYKADEYGVFFKDFAKVEDEVRDTATLLKDKIYNITHPRTAK